MTQRLARVSPELERALTVGTPGVALFADADIRRETTYVAMRDGVQLATDLYLPPLRQAPSVVIRTPYGRATQKIVNVCSTFAGRGYIAIAQDCRGTGDSEPDDWDYYVYEPEDGFDLVEWISRQVWSDGFIGACGGSYAGQTQWCMATHPCMSVIAPEVSGLGVAVNTARLYMFLNSYARSVGKVAGRVAIPHTELERVMLEETLAGGYFNEPLHLSFSETLLERYPMLRSKPPSEAKRWLWEQYCALSCAGRAELIKQALGARSVSIVEVEALPAIFGHRIAHDAHTLPHVNPAERFSLLHAPALMITGWYDWGLNDALATWALLRQSADQRLRSRSRLIISPGAHSKPGYHEGDGDHPELQRTFRLENNVSLLLQWYAAARTGEVESWPTVIYYLMGANEWRVSRDWPPPEARQVVLYLGDERQLSVHPPRRSIGADRYTYDPDRPTPTLGGSVLSYVYPQGSVDVSEAQQRADVLAYTTPPLQRPLDVVGPLRMVLYASSSVIDTDFSVRLSDVFPDGRAIQLQSGILRARHRGAEPELLQPGRVYRLEIDLWATANRFQAGHRLRIDVSSADFPRFDRNSNLGGQAGRSVPALQTICRDAEHPSHLIASVLGADPAFEEG
jgi:predicted acyl esterase